MRVLIACEFSGIVRDAFAARGHDAWSCDLLPTERVGQHIIGDVFDVIGSGSWDMLLHFWPCTLLCNSGVRWLARSSNRMDDMRISATNFRRLMDCGIPKICGENPIPHKYARAIMGQYTHTLFNRMSTATVKLSGRAFGCVGYRALSHPTLSQDAFRAFTLLVPALIAGKNAAAPCPVLRKQWRNNGDKFVMQLNNITFNRRPRALELTARLHDNGAVRLFLNERKYEAL
jgi:hypothetical protein